MHRKAHNINAIHWSRWSRARWAVFAGLGRAIVIGVLSVSVCYAAMRKNNVVTATDINTAEVSDFAIDADDIPDDIAINTISDIIETIDARNSSDAAAKALNENNYGFPIMNYVPPMKPRNS